MNISLADAISLSVAIASFISVIWIAAVKLTTLEVKVDTIWDFIMRRAIGEGVRSGIMQGQTHDMEYPKVIRVNAKRWMEPLAADLRHYYATIGHKLSDRSLSLEIERRFGQRILDEVCIPHNIFKGECLIIAMEVAKEGFNGKRGQ